ncbi:MAG: hypothetical protein H0A75_01430 [Candidatus Methanofishera endochildressiae]|uniref:Uncharacterized protein n=1 Tax=Candidatus Methanofishera endochildressiae TaxID=2738884 RepID=A0A7Z0MMQ2_9GAMM|nr:hypothetical protein [Candidatus Methanofishera endochildressiae]
MTKALAQILVKVAKDAAIRHALLIRNSGKSAEKIAALLMLTKRLPGVNLIFDGGFYPFRSPVSTIE